MHAILRQRFGPEFDDLSWQDQGRLIADFRDLLRDEYDVPDDTMSAGIEQENTESASREYRRRIGGGNLLAYAKTLAAAK